MLATGADSRWLGVAGEEDFKGGGISSCATCDGLHSTTARGVGVTTARPHTVQLRAGFLFTGKPVVVVGGGDTAMEEALVLARTSSHVPLLYRRGEWAIHVVVSMAVVAAR